MTEADDETEVTRMAKPTVPTILDINAVAARCGVRREWIEKLRGRGDMPDPDVVLGNTPGWLETTIDPWWQSRTHRARGG